MEYLRSLGSGESRVGVRWQGLWPLLLVLVGLRLEMKAQGLHDAIASGTPATRLESLRPDATATDAVPQTQPHPSASNHAQPGQESSSNDAKKGACLLPVTENAAPGNNADRKFNLKGALVQSFEVELFSQAWRVAFDPSLRYLVAHKPFFHDWFASYPGFNMHRWGDGDDFVVNDVGHPLGGAVFARNFLINSPNSLVAIGKNSRYWTTRLKAMAWAAAWSTQSEIGALSEVAFGNEGGWTYVPGCGTSLACLNNPKYPKPPTNNTGWTDFVMTPVVGLLWVIGEDTLDKYVVSPIAVNHRILGGHILRTALEPSRSFAGLFAGKFPWMMPQYDNNFVVHTKPQVAKVPKAYSPKPPVDHWEIGTQYTSLSLPVLGPGCSDHGCRQYNSGMGFNFNYNLTREFGFDSTVNLLPAQGGSKPMVEGLFGIKWGERWQHFGIFGKVRPGFIYYEKAMPGAGVYTPESLSRFAADFGGIVEVYPARNSTLRFDVGTTLVRYLANYTDPRTSPLGSLLSNQYVVTQGNFQFSTGYAYRF